MKNFNLFEYGEWHPFAQWNFIHPFWTVHIDTILYTWISIAIITILALLGRWSLKNSRSLASFISEQFIRTCKSMINQTIEGCSYRHMAFICSLFIFIFICNCIILFPFTEEPTKDLNTTVALALITFFYVQKEGIRAHGLRGYLAEFFKPFAIMFPLEVLSKLTTIISLSFRLFGNIFGGSVISGMWHAAIAHSLIGQLVGIFFGINLILLLFFGLFEGLIQAFVFSILSLTYLSMAIRKETHE